MEQPLSPAGSSLLLALLCAGCPADDDGGPGGSGVVTADLVGVWHGPVPEADRADERTALVLQLDPPEADGRGRYGIFSERVQITRGGPYLTLDDDGLWRVEDGHVVFESAAQGTETANEILAAEGDSMTLETFAATSRRLAYTRGDGSCPDPIEREGWHATTRALMATEVLDASPGYSDIVLDSKGRVHAIAGGSDCRGGPPCHGVGLPTTYFAREAGCRWQAYSFAFPFAATKLLITPDDTLHALGHTLEGIFHFTASADRALEGNGGWTQVPPGDLGSTGPDAAIAPLDAIVAGGDLWLVAGKPEPVSGSQVPFLYRYEGSSWSEVGAIDASPIEPVALSEDGAGGVHVVVFGEPPRAGLRIYSAADLTALQRTLDVPAPCAPADTIVEADGAVHVACNVITAVRTGDHIYQAGYAVHDGSDWSLVPLGYDHARRIARRGDGFMLIGDTVWLDDGAAWRAAGPLFRANRILEGITEGRGISDMSAVYDPARDVVHMVDRNWYAWLDGAPSGETRVSITFEGPGAGRVRSSDGVIDCTSTCTAAVPAGRMLTLAVEPDATSSFASLRGAPGTISQTPVETAPGTFTVWATGELGLVVSFDEGAPSATRTFAAMGGPRVTALADGGVIVVGAYRAGFAPEGEPLAADPSFPNGKSYVMRLDADLEVSWFEELAPLGADECDTLDIASDGSAVLSGTRIARGFDLAARTVTWSYDASAAVFYRHTRAVALDGGRAAVLGYPEEGLPATGAPDVPGVIVLDAAGQPQVLHANDDPFSQPQDAPGLFVGSGERVIATAISGNNHAVIAFDLESGFEWSFELGMRIDALAGDGAGGAWAVSTLGETIPECTQSDGTGMLFHVDAAGRCVFRGVGLVGVVPQNPGAIAPDGRGLQFTIAGAFAALQLTRPDEPFASTIPLSLDTNWRGASVSWGPDGKHVAYGMFLADGTFTGAIGTAVFP